MISQETVLAGSLPAFHSKVRQLMSHHPSRWLSDPFNPGSSWVTPTVSWTSVQSFNVRSRCWRSLDHWVWQSWQEVGHGYQQDGSLARGQVLVRYLQFLQGLGSTLSDSVRHWTACCLALEARSVSFELSSEVAATSWLATWQVMA